MDEQSRTDREYEEHRAFEEAMLEEEKCRTDETVRHNWENERKQDEIAKSLKEIERLEEYEYWKKRYVDKD